jgi:hypothetical protein
MIYRADSSTVILVDVSHFRLRSREEWLCVMRQFKREGNFLEKTPAVAEAGFAKLPEAVVAPVSQVKARAA